MKRFETDEGRKVEGFLFVDPRAMVTPVCAAFIKGNCTRGILCGLTHYRAQQLPADSLTETWLKGKSSWLKASHRIHYDRQPSDREGEPWICCCS